MNLLCVPFMSFLQTEEPDAATSRIGRLYLFKFQLSGDAPLTELQRVDTSAVLDLKW